MEEGCSCKKFLYHLQFGIQEVRFECGVIKGPGQIFASFKFRDDGPFVVYQKGKVIEPKSIVFPLREKDMKGFRKFTKVDVVAYSSGHHEIENEILGYSTVFIGDLFDDIMMEIRFGVDMNRKTQSGVYKFYSFQTQEPIGFFVGSITLSCFGDLPPERLILAASNRRRPTYPCQKTVNVVCTNENRKSSTSLVPYASSMVCDNPTCPSPSPPPGSCPPPPSKCARCCAPDNPFKNLLYDPKNTPPKDTKNGNKDKDKPCK